MRCTLCPLVGFILTSDEHLDSVDETRQTVGSQRLRLLLVIEGYGLNVGYD